MKPTTHLCAIMRDEGKYVLEWVAYHRVIGLDLITIYDNRSSDETEAVCRGLAAQGIISYVKWDRDAGLDGHFQVSAYQHAASATTADWICFLDADEFLVLENAATIDAWLAQAGRDGMPIALNWRIFGSGGHIEASSGLVTARFVRCSTKDFRLNKHIKTFGPTAAIRAGAEPHIHGWPLAADQHYVDATGQHVAVEGHSFVDPPRHVDAWINHYIVKSQQDFEGKIRRWAATDRWPVANRKLRERYFTMHDMNEEEDRTIQRVLPLLVEEIARLERILRTRELDRREPGVGWGQPGVRLKRAATDAPP